VLLKYGYPAAPQRADSMSAKVSVFALFEYHFVHRLLEAKPLPLTAAGFLHCLLETDG